jgi:S1-C subfamily serine protease
VHDADEGRTRGTSYMGTLRERRSSPTLIVAGALGGRFGRSTAKVREALVRRLISAAPLVLALSVFAGCGGTAPAPQPSSAASAPTNFADLIDKVKSGVIRIEATGCGETAIGTGFLIKPDLVATVEHVVDGASTITLKRDGKILGTAKVIGADRDRDLALQTKAAITGYTFGFASLAPRLGEDVGVLGFPLGLPLTVTQGSVSGFNRVVPIDGVKRRHLVQTDAAVNRGNSGGPVLSRSTGEIVGLVDLGTNGANGVAFAVSAQVAAPLLRAWAQAPQSPAEAICTGARQRSNGVSATGSPTPANYSNAVDTALIDSARTRTGLGQLIDDVNNGSFNATTAVNAITAVIDQRRQLLSDVQSVPPPAEFARAADLLKASLVSALTDDLAIQDWITATYQGNTTAANAAWQRNIQISQQSSTAKAQFLKTYNRVRRQLLGLAPLDVAY